MAIQAPLQMTDEQVTQFKRFDSIWRTNGWDPESKRHITIKDALDIQNAAFMIPRVMTQIIQEGIEPLLIGTSLLTRIDFVPGMQTVFPAIPPLRAEESGDGMGLPIYNIDVGGAATFGTQGFPSRPDAEDRKALCRRVKLSMDQHLAASGRQRSCAPQGRVHLQLHHADSAPLYSTTT